MTGNKFSIGLDCQLVVIGPSGQVNLTHVTGFESRQNTQSIRVSRMDGINLGAELPKGWEGSFEIERGSSAVDDMIAAIELGYYSGGNLGGGTLYQFISETDGLWVTDDVNANAKKGTQLCTGIRCGLACTRRPGPLAPDDSVQLFIQARLLGRKICQPSSNKALR